MYYHVCLSDEIFGLVSVMEGHCFCLEETGELCDECFGSWTGRHGCITEPTSPPLTPTQPLSDDDEEMADAAVDGAQASPLEADFSPRDAELLASSAAAGGPFRAPARVPSYKSRDPYGDYLKKQKTGK